MASMIIYFTPIVIDSVGFEEGCMPSHKKSSNRASRRWGSRMEQGSISFKNNEKSKRVFFGIFCTLVLMYIIYRPINSCLISNNRHWFYWEESALLAVGVSNFFLFCTAAIFDTSWIDVFTKAKHGLIVGVCFFLPNCIFLYLSYKALKTGELKLHIIYILLLVAFFSILDFIIIYLAKKKNISTIQDEFEKNFYFSDIPTLLAFGLLLTIYSCYIEPMYIITKIIPLEYYENLFGGAIAFQLIVSIVIFIVISLGANTKTAT